jgi:hypothetical protein
MEHKPLSELQALADISIVEPAPMTREQRLERWIEVLEANASRKLRPLYEIEYLSAEDLRKCRSDGSPLSVAYEDPVLRAEGLKSDRLGDCIAFFEITDRQMHHAFCSCHIGMNFDARQAAARLRQFLPVTGGGIVKCFGELFGAR